MRAFPDAHGVAPHKSLSNQSFPGGNFRHGRAASSKKLAWWHNSLRHIDFQEIWV